MFSLKNPELYPWAGEGTDQHTHHEATAPDGGLFHPTDWVYRSIWRGKRSTIYQKRKEKTVLFAEGFSKPQLNWSSHPQNYRVTISMHRKENIPSEVIRYAQKYQQAWGSPGPVRGHPTSGFRPLCAALRGLLITSWWCLHPWELNASHKWIPHAPGRTQKKLKH